MNDHNKKSFQTYYYASPRPGGIGPEHDSQRRRTRRRWLRPLLSVLTVIIIAAGCLIWYHHTHVKHSVASAKGTSEAAAKQLAAPPPSGLSVTTLGTLGQSINSIISANSGIDISVNLIDLDGGQAEHYGTSETFLAASTAKILTAEYFLHQVEAGKESLSETINGNSAQYELQQMIVVSDDNAWDALNTDLGYDNLQSYADSVLGISDYQAYNNVLSSGDIALALQKLWDGDLLNSADTQLLLSYLKQANYREYIVPAVPAEDTIYHKIGLYEDNVHDAAIITHDSQAFVIVIFTNGHGTYDWTDRATIMQDITKAALSAYFNQS